LAGHVVGIGAIRNTYKILDGKPEGKRPRGKPRCRCEDNIRISTGERGWKVLDCIHLAQNRDKWQGNESSCSIKGGVFLV
jgi:hypothetical protein